jgi:hypothetical protein
MAKTLRPTAVVFGRTEATVLGLSKPALARDTSAHAVR